MDHVAIDLGSKESQICVRDEEGKIIEEDRRSTCGLGKYLGGRPMSRVVFETCSEAFRLADEALEAGHEVRVVPSVLVRTLGVGARGIKTDVRDARALSEASCRLNLPSVHIPSAISRKRKSACGMREALVSARTRLINTIRGWLRTQGVGVRRGSASSFTRRVREKLVGREPDMTPPEVSGLLSVIDSLSRELLEADKRLAATAKADPLCRRLMTVPGVGPVTSVRFVAAVDDPKRFADGHALESYLGLTPGENSSSMRVRRTHLTKAGSPQVRRVLVQAAWCAVRTARIHPMVQWMRAVERRRGTKVAIIALARKMAGILFALWRDGSTYTAWHRSADKLAADSTSPICPT